MQQQNRTVIERIIHAVGFEAIAIAICAPLGSWLLGRPLWHMGAMAMLLSTIAMLWNMIYNIIFDSLWPREKIIRAIKVRVLHAIGFELGFVFIGVFILAILLNISLLQAFLLEIGFFAFFLPYTLIYNWAYDRVRYHLIENRYSRKHYIS